MEYTPLKFTYSDMVGLAKFKVAMSPQWVLPVQELSKVPCIVMSAVGLVPYTAAVCNASLPFFAGWGLMNSLWEYTGSISDSVNVNIL